MTPLQIRHLRMKHKLDTRTFGQLVWQSERAVRAWELGERNMPTALLELILMKLNETELLDNLRKGHTDV